MKTLCTTYRLRASVLAVQGALGALSLAHAETDPALTELTQHKSTIEIGVGGSNTDSAKANEYTGLKDKKAYLIGNVDIEGGGAYDSDSTTRWSLSGAKLGTSSRSVDAQYRQQGNFRVRLGYDELRRNQTDTYQTPYQNIGSNNLTLPTWPTVPTANSHTLPQANLDAFRAVDLFTQRKKYGIGADIQLSERWALSTSISHEHKSGLRAQSVHTELLTEQLTVLPMPVDQDDDKIALGVEYVGDKVQFRTEYEGSSFKNNVPYLAWKPWAGAQAAGAQDEVSTAPSNMFHKLSATGTYQIAPKSRMTASLAYSRNTQNDTFLTESLPYDPTVLPNLVGVTRPTSANAVVVGKSAQLKLAQGLTKDWSANAGYQFDERENQTPVNNYGFYSDNGTPAAGLWRFASLVSRVDGVLLGSNFNYNANTPYSRRTNRANVDVEGRLGSGNVVRMGLDSQKTDRYCLGTWNSAVSCADASESRETTARLELRAQTAENVATRLAYAYSKRTVDYNENAWLARVPLAGQTPTGAPAGSTAYDTLIANGLSGFGPLAGWVPLNAATPLGFYFPSNNYMRQAYYGNRDRISELAGMRRYDQANRKRQKFRSSADIQASETLSIQAGFDFSDDDYTQSTYGLQDVQNIALNVEGTYAPSDSYSLSLFGSYEYQRTRTAGHNINDSTNTVGAAVITGGCYAAGTTLTQRNLDYKINPCMDWATVTRDVTTTYGGSFTAKRVAGSKLSLTGSGSYSVGSTSMDVFGGNFISATNPAYIPAQPLPEVHTKSLELGLSAEYQLSAASALRVGYGLQWVKSTDWAYEGLQTGTGVIAQLPTLEQSPAYKVTRVGVAYAFSFR